MFLEATMKQLSLLVFILLCVVVWGIIVYLFQVPNYVLPSPENVLKEFINDPFALTLHFLLTFSEAVLGLTLAWVLAFGFSIILFIFPKIENLIMPILVGFKAIPLIAIAPLLILWFGNGFLSKCVMAGTIAFFPLLINYLKGYRACNDDEILFLRNLGLNRFQELWSFRYYKSTPFWLAGLKISSVLAAVGAIVAEFSGAKSGLGYLVIVSSVRIDTPLLFVGIILSAFCGIALYIGASLIERFLLKKRHMEPLSD